MTRLYRDGNGDFHDDGNGDNGGSSGWCKDSSVEHQTPKVIILHCGDSVFSW